MMEKTDYFLPRFSQAKYIKFKKHIIADKFSYISTIKIVATCINLLLNNTKINNVISLHTLF